MRFGNYDYIKEKFEKYLESQKPSEISDPSDSPQAKKPVVTDASNHSLAPKPAVVATDGSRTRKGSGYADYASRQENNTAIGRESEQIVFTDLKEKYGAENVKWVSQFAYDANENLDGSDDAEYDMEYSTEDERKYLVDVKTNSSKLPSISFILTEPERNFASDHSLNYQIAIVSNPKTDSPEIRFFSWNQVKAFANTPKDYFVEFVDEGDEDGA